MFSYQLDAFWAILSPPIIYYLFGIPLAVLYLLNLVDMATGIMAAITCHHFSWKVMLAGIPRFIFFYGAMWLALFTVGIATTAISLLNVVMFFSGGIVLTVSVTGIYSILCAVIVISILENVQEAETGVRNGFCGERKMFYDILKKPFVKVAKQTQFDTPPFGAVGNPTAPPTTTKGGEF
jgi:phage-related holin